MHAGPVQRQGYPTDRSTSTLVSVAAGCLTAGGRRLRDCRAPSCRETWLGRIRLLSSHYMWATVGDQLIFTGAQLPTSSARSVQWLPVNIYGRYATVRWMLADTSIFTEPFFDTAISKLRCGSPPSAEHETDVDILLSANSEGSSFRPSGLVVHMTRCGSTLVLNALKEARSVAALGEAQPFDRGLRLATSLSSYWSAVGRAILTAGAGIFGRSSVASRDALIIKWGVGGLMGLKVMRAVWPDVPCLILVRNPMEVVVSNVQPPSQWLVQACAVRQTGLAPQRHDFGPLPGKISSTDLVNTCAWMLGRGCEDILSNIDPLCMVLDYENISPASVLAVAERFGLSFSPDGLGRFEQCFNQNAKSRQQIFVGDSERKRQAATLSIQRAVNDWAEVPYLRLKELSMPRHV